MIIIKVKEDLKNYLKQSSVPIGFVPTMGALHNGHLALIQEARKHSATVVCSIFVNPTQFNDPKDFEKYPVTIEKDIEMLEKAGTDFLFLPSVTELYPNGTKSLEKYNLGFLETILEGSFRPGHFQGVCQVMNRLLTAVSADRLFMGQKDYQQCMVIRRLLEITGIQTALITCKTIREKDGLAMSSRNRRLNEEARQRAIGIIQAMIYCKNHLIKGDLSGLKLEAKAILHKYLFKIDYVEFANKNTLSLRDHWDGSEPLVVLIAAFQDEVRLIDNMELTS